MKKTALYFLNYIFLAVLLSAPLNGNTEDILTNEEQLWLSQNHSKLLYALETNYAPFVFIDSNDQPAGLAYDYLVLLESKLGIKFKQKRFSSLSDIFSKVKSKEVDIVNAVTKTQKRSKFLSFTTPFVSVPNVIIVNKNKEGVMREEDLSGHKVSLVKSYAITDYLLNKWSGIIPDITSNDLSALLNVSFGTSDAAVIDLATASYLISKNGITNLKVAGETEYNINLSMASSIDEPMLRSILQKALATISDEEKREIHNRWINPYAQSIFNDWRFWAVVGSVLLISFVVIIWNRILGRQIELRIKAEKELQTLNAQLKQQVEEAVAKRMEAEVENFKELDRLKTLFIASMSHELRTPLNAIIGFSGTLKSEMAGPLNTKQKEQLGRIKQAGSYLLEIIVEVLDISKIESGQIPLSIEKFSIKDLIEESIEKLHNNAINKGIELSSIVDKNIEISSDQNLLMKVIDNYLSNALKYSTEGSIVISARQKGNLLELEVSDEGIGIEQENIKNLFQPFERLDSPLKVIAGGTGLGLYLTRKIVEDLLHGEVYVNSKINIGSTFGFRIALPRKSITPT